MARTAPVPGQLVDDAARRLRVLGDPTRLRLLNALYAEGELSVGELARRAETSLANASKHLTVLERERLVARRRSGTAVLYRISDPTLAAVCEAVCDGLRERYAAAARLRAVR